MVIAAVILLGLGLLAVAVLQLKTLMKLSEVKQQIALAAAQSTEAFSELSAKIAELQKQIDDLIAGAGDPEVGDEAFLADLKTVRANVQALAEIVPNPGP